MQNYAFPKNWHSNLKPDRFEQFSWETPSYLSIYLPLKLRQLWNISYPKLTTCENDKLPFTTKDYYTL